MKIFLYLIVLIIAFTKLSYSHQSGQDLFTLNAPNNWKKETIKFPLDFAPEIKYQGFEELRFSPGMFDTKSDTYFSYLFFWFIDGQDRFSKTELEENLELYFKGLCKEVGKSKGLKIEINNITASLKEYEPKNTNQDKYHNFYRGVIKAYDPFNGGKEITLNIETATLKTSNKNKAIIFFCLSPKEYDSSIWNSFYDIRNSLRVY
jgi:hypothetical protein